MKLLHKAILPALITAALTGNVWAQERDDCVELKGTPPGMYVTTEQGETYMLKDGKAVTLSAGDAGFANADGITCIQKPPEFLAWPCTTQAAQSRMFNTYTIDDLKSSNPLKEIVQRYFDVPEILAPIPDWIDGQYNGIFNYNDLIQFSSPEYWYFTNPNVPVLSGKRPKSLLISLYVGTNQVVLDNNMLDALRKELGTNDIPVTFVFNDSNTVPISYFGSNASLEEVQKAFNERGIKVADVPMWWQGDYTLLTTVEEFEKFFDIPALEEIPADRQAALKADLEANGFTRKSIIVTLFAESGAMAVDQPERIRMAASMGIDRIPTTFSFIEEDSIVAHCGPGTPVGTGGVSGSTTPVGGATVPPGAPVAPAPSEPEIPVPPPPASPS
ncbi:hypothetical protein ACFL00_00015 [Pseudomonadota bacterium]